MADPAAPAGVPLRDSIPPHNIDAEVATLGALLLDPEALSTVLRYLRADDFYRAAHRKVYQAILALFDRNEAIDLITLCDELGRVGELEACGGMARISQLTSAVPTSANVEYYARIVQGLSMRRELQRIAASIISDSFDDSREVRIIIEEAERRIFEITDRQQSGSFRLAREIINQTVDAIERLYHSSGSYTGIPSGFADLDNLTSGFQNSEFVVIGARPSVGKTALALTMAANIAVQQRKPVGFFTLEMSAVALMQRLLAAEARLDSNRIRSGMLRPSDFHKITDAAGRLYDAPLFIEDSPNLKLLDLRAQARRMKSNHSVEIVFIDYLTLISSENQDLPRHEQIAEISRSLKALARELDVPVLALSQVRRETEGKLPNLADLRESGSIEQDADVVMFLHRERGTDENLNERETDLIVAKQRNGPVGKINLTFFPEYTTFESHSPRD
ncbi:MAG: replicative DNA helicase [Spirochaetaceae bacterium]|nr:replicative DNA helicase [Spirochaetaceae bacterium]MDE0227710.1 replicative DNA helicase [Spirochaetaceae bacterium]MDE0449775.1 replicative DNA helicase [Spirochaetaceae bacterium]